MNDNTTLIDKILGVLLAVFLVLGSIAFGTYIFTSSAKAQEIPTVRLCTGSAGNPYADAGETIARMAGGRLKIQVINTEGTWDNIDKIRSGACDAFIGQPDGTTILARQNPAEARNLKKVATLHTEYLQVLCSKKSGITDLKKLGPKHQLALGKEGSGAWLLWQNLVANDKAYSKVPITNDAGILALTNVANNEVTCLIRTAGVPDTIISTANANLSNDVILAEASAWSFNNATDIDGSPLYEFADLPKVYKNLMGWGSWSTLSWKAALYISKPAPVFQKEATLADFLMAVTRAKTQIIAQYDK